MGALAIQCQKGGSSTGPMGAWWRDASHSPAKGRRHTARACYFGEWLVVAVAAGSEPRANAGRGRDYCAWVMRVTFPCGAQYNVMLLVRSGRYPVLWLSGRRERLRLVPRIMSHLILHPFDSPCPV